MVFTATAAILLDKEAFNQLVAEEDLKVWEVDGYIYTKKRGKSGIELYRTYGPKWKYIWTYKQVCTQDNAGGGTLRVDVTPASGTTLTFGHGNMLASGNRATQATVRDSAGVVIAWVSVVGATAGAQSTWPDAAGASTASSAAVNVQNMPLGAGEYFSAQVTSAAQTETATINMAWVLTSETAPTVSWANSGGTPNAAAATINTVTAVLMP